MLQTHRPLSMKPVSSITTLCWDSSHGAQLRKAEGDKLRRWLQVLRNPHNSPCFLCKETWWRGASLACWLFQLKSPVLSLCHSWSLMISLSDAIKNNWFRRQQAGKDCRNCLSVGGLFLWITVRLCVKSTVFLLTHFPYTDAAVGVVWVG